MPKITEYSLQKLTESVRNKTISPLQIVQAFFDKIESEDAQISAWCYLDKEGALRTASELSKEAEANKFRGPLHGIPVGIKDNIEVKGMPTKLGSKIWSSREPSKRDAEFVKKLKAMGAIIIGKTHMTEYAWLDPAPTKNPHNRKHTPGGSSSGSAAAVAANMVPLALGSQTAASVSRPAAYCGIAGFKPTMDSVYQDVGNLAPTFDTIGFFAKDTEDFSFVVGNPNKHTSINETLKIGVIEDPLYNSCSHALTRLLDDLIERFSGAHEIISIKPAHPFQELIRLHRIILAYEVAKLYKELAEEHTEKLSKNFLDLIAEGLTISWTQYHNSLSVMEEIKNSFWNDSAAVDLFVTLPASSSAPFGLETTGDPKFTIPWTVLGGPLSVIPTGFDEEGLPLSLMLASAPNTDQELLSYSSLATRLLKEEKLQL